MSVWNDITRWLYDPMKLGESFARHMVTQDLAERKRPVIGPTGPVKTGGLETDRSPFGLLPVAGGPSSPFARDPMQDYLNQLLRGLNVAGRPQIQSVQELRAQAAKQAGLQFDPQINALIGERSATKSRAGKNRKEIGSLYSGLADEYLGDVKTSKKATNEAKKAEKSAFDQLQKSITGEYSSQLDNQSQELKNLGLGAALADSTKGQKEDLDFLRGLNSTESAAQQRSIDLSGLADTSYYQKGSDVAKHEGAETISDLMSQLEDYMRQTGSDLTSLRGQKAGTIENLFNQLQSGQANNESEFENQRWNRLLQIAQFQRGLQNDSLSQMAAGSKTNTPTKGLEGAFAVLQDSLGGNSQRSINGLMNLLQQQQFREGRFESGNKDIVEMTPENAAYMARQYASQQKLSPQETDALVKAVYAYYGKLR